MASQYSQRSSRSRPPRGRRKRRWGPSQSSGDRLVMMHRGRVVHDDAGADKRRLRPDDLLARFEAIRRGELLDESAAAMLSAAYV